MYLIIQLIDKKLTKLFLCLLVIKPILHPRTDPSLHVFLQCQKVALDEYLLHQLFEMTVFDKFIEQSLCVGECVHVENDCEVEEAVFMGVD